MMAALHRAYDWTFELPNTRLAEARARTELLEMRALSSPFQDRSRHGRGRVLQRPTDARNY